MKVIPFKIAASQAESIIVSEDILPYFYGHMHRHKEMQLTLILKGTGTLIVGNYTQPFAPGDFYIIGANQPHILKSDPIYYQNNVEGSVHAVHIFFEHENTLSHLINLPEMEFAKSFLEKTRQGLQIPEGYAPEAARLFLKASRSSGLKRLLISIKLLQYLSRHVKEYKLLTTDFAAAPFPAVEDIRLNEVYQYTLEHYAENITLERIAAVVHITPHAFCKYFKKHTRKTYNAFLNEIRINEACKRIVNGDATCIASIAYATGFNSAINFNKVFKKTTGKSPSEFMKEYRHKWDNALKLLRQPACLIPMFASSLSVLPASSSIAAQGLVWPV
ncbi:AraC family transcriptional regulator [Pontibacter akesuensis]|uniref:AraC-type DNA-binding protein n=1 Tax=Pontibacter akesuensis TaxID=388950 RepID=A0A1I7J2Q2_9BACT|nr:AraC family transcriptional regulator [Pontibacter akesuensis]GHA72763.1 AraC family transcriptional regulator [Pontibacter akesuensis]SFU79422.1 AraC-type DNA-binding protein [Pontibacter akesuensis]